ncbi:hypothetical protein Vafri_1627, partial [Volvox africanus]
PPGPPPLWHAAPTEQYSPRPSTAPPPLPQLPAALPVAAVLMPQPAPHSPPGHRTFAPAAPQAPGAGYQSAQFQTRLQLIELQPQHAPLPVSPAALRPPIVRPPASALQYRRPQRLLPRPHGPRPPAAGAP